MDISQARLVALVAVGGAIGSVLRYGVTGVLTTRDFPWGTFVVNFTGTFLLALLFFAFLQGGSLPPGLRTFLFIGIFGGYTTFSTFGLETISLYAEGQPLLAGANILLNAGLCLVGAYLGRAAGLAVGIR